MKILIVEDDDITRISLQHIFLSIGEVICCKGYEEFILAHSMSYFDLLILDLDLEHPLLGLEILKKFKSLFNYRVILTGHEQDEIIQNCYELGAHDFLCKPFNSSEVESLIRRIKIESTPIRCKLKEDFSMLDEDLIDEIEAQIIELSSVSSLLLKGETGTGKTKLARFIHKNIFNGPFVHINCAEIPEGLVESELFGYRRGAFTGANKDKIGKLRLADGGILFLDEFTALSANIQRKLLVALEEKNYFPIGSNRKEFSHFFLICASCDDLDLLRKAGELREDFYYRVGEACISLPPLRARSRDFDFLLASNLNKGRRVLLSDEIVQYLRAYSWPGNIREFHSVIRRLKSQKNPMIELNVLDRLLGDNSFEKKQKSNSLTSSKSMILQARALGLSNFIKKLEKEITKEILDQNDNLVRKTIKDLKLSKSTFYRIINS